jgi:hypothetical protein
LNTANTGGHGIHVISRQPANDALPQRRYGSGQIHPHYRRQWLSRMFRLPGADFSVQRIDTAGPDPDQYLPRLRHGPCHGNQT